MRLVKMILCSVAKATTTTEAPTTTMAVETTTTRVLPTSMDEENGSGSLIVLGAILGAFLAN